jgi:hypothetical protein
MKKSHLKSFVRNMVKEAILKEMAGADVDAATATTRLTPHQRQVVAALMQRKFKPVKYMDAGNNQVNIVLEQPYRAAADEGNRFANVAPNGRINRDQLDVRTFLKGVMGEGQPVGGVKNDHAFDDGREAVMKAVNVEEGFGSREQECDCGSGLPSEWELDGQGIPLVRACDKCRKKKLARYRPEILGPYTQADVDEPIEPDVEEQTGSGAAGAYATPFAFKKKVKERIMPDGRYDDDMESALHSKKISGMSENEKKTDYERHGPCSCGSGLPAYAKLDAKGIPIARVCKRCDRKQRTKIKALSKSPKPIKFDDEDDLDLTEIANFGMALLSTTGGLLVYKVLRNVIDSMADNKWKNARLTDHNINALFKAVKNKNPKIQDAELQHFRDEVKRAVESGSIRTIDDLKRYLESMNLGKVNEVNKRGLDYQIVKRVKNASYKFFKANVENIQIAYKNGPDDIVFEVYLGPEWVRKFVRFHGINRPFEVWDESKEQFVPTNMSVRNFQEDTNIQEMTGTGAVAGYTTPFAFTKHKDGSKRALDVTKKLGFKVAKSISEEENILK